MDRNPFHFAHLDAIGASQPGMAVADEFHEASRDAKFGNFADTFAKI